jgi:hypothetical protein
LDISQMHTYLLEPPEYLWPLVPTTRLSLTSPQPMVASPEQHDKGHFAEHHVQTMANAEHLRAALRLRDEAEQLLEALTQCSAQANTLVQRWFGFMHTERRSPQQTAQYVQLEERVLVIARQLASLRHRHAACLAQAREHEEAAGLTAVPRMRSEGTVVTAAEVSFTALNW